MKKPVAILVLIFGGAVIMAVAVVLTLMFFLMLASIIPEEGSWAVYVVTVMFLMAASYPTGFIREYYKLYHNINSPVFTVLFCAPTCIAAGASYLLYSPTENEASGASVKTALLVWLVITAVFTFWMIVHACVDAYKRYRDKNG